MWLICFLIGHNYEVVEKGVVFRSGEPDYSCCWYQESIIKCRRCAVENTGFASGCSKNEESEIEWVRKVK